MRKDLIYIDGMTIKEIAEKYGYTERRVRDVYYKRDCKTLEKIRDYLDNKLTERVVRLVEGYTMSEMAREFGVTRSTAVYAYNKYGPDYEKIKNHCLCFGGNSRRGLVYRKRRMKKAPTSKIKPGFYTFHMPVTLDRRTAYTKPAIYCDNED